MSNFSSTPNAPTPPQVQQQQVQPQQQAAPSQNQPMSFTPVSASSSVSTPVTSAVGVSAPASASIPSQSVLGGSTRSPAPPPISGNVDGAATPASTSTSVPVPSVSAPGTQAAITSASIATSVPNAQSNTSVPISSSGPAPGLAGNASASAPAATQTEPQPSNQDTFWAARREEEIARRDRSLAELLVMLDGYKPLIPEEVTEYFLQRSGFDCSDPRLKRLLSLVAQKFISDLSRDAFHFSKLRVNGATAGRGRPAAGVDRNRVVLTMDDLSLALGEHGVNLKAPDYYL
ncbi:transcription initiation factor TFIID subunit 10 [Cryptococcus neoformans]|nr:transcription initiation factor TFIID subunit 10 [Cryptococcus neoformans var. grubii]